MVHGGVYRRERDIASRDESEEAQMKYALAVIISSIAGYAIGQYVTRRRIQRGITQAVDTFSASMRSALGDIDKVIEDVRQKAQPAPVSDTLAREPLPLRPGDVDRALAAGGLAVFKDGNWNA
jgi:hypothetical protein